MDTSKDYVISLLRDKYEYEQKRKEDFESSLGTPITVLSALFAGSYFVVSDSSLIGINCSLVTIKWILVILLLIALVVTLIFLFVVYFGFKRRYCSFPDSNTVYNGDFKALEQYAKENYPETSEEVLMDNLKDRAIEWYLDCNNNNTAVNDTRGNSLFYAKLSICISLSIGLALLILICFIKSI
ncbi:putative membrane protein [Pedobacter sp. AK013]|uniref:hypothetical protein n=1 Tax=Pedobacter sp. AK013 TaxID=2723071 RepID=UPI00162197AC|nr:hypothetical protein [Pedobacter sp. AK013]MBB6236908.1 putative membrane protein [Pedobacter sp. AK013]